MKDEKTNKYRILLFGYVLILGTYFIGRTIQFFTMQTAEGEVTGIVWRKFTVGVPPSGRGVGGGGDYKDHYQCPEVHFVYKGATDTGNRFMVRPESLSFREYKAGDKVTVIFPGTHPELARIYSLGEFWFIPPYMIILAVIVGLWSIGFLVVVFKPWRQMDE